MKSKVPSPFATRIAAGYALIAGIWILVSDRVLEALSPSSSWLTTAQTYKGWGFVLLTAMLLYVLIRHEMLTLQHAQAARDLSIRRLENLHRLDQEILEARSIQHVVQTASRHLYRVIACERIVLGVLDLPTSEWLVFPSESAGIMSSSQRLANPPCWINDLRNGQIKMVQNAQKDGISGDPECTPIIADGMRSLLYAPLMVKAELIGVIGLAATAPSFFTPEHRDIVKEVANQLAIALQQVHLTEELSQHTAELEQNIAERQRTEHALRVSEARLAQAQQLAKLGSWEIDLATGQVSWSAEMYRLMGISPSSGALGRADFLKRIHPEDQQRVEAAVTAATETRSPTTLEFRSHPNHGPVRHFASNIEPGFDDAGHTVRLVGTLQDITERRRAEEVARETEVRYLRALDTMLEGCQIIGFDWRYLYLNDAAARYGRQEKRDLLGHTMMECYPGIEETHLFDVLRMCMEDHASRMEEFEFFYEDQSSAWFRTSIHPVPEGIFVLSLEITADKRAAEAIRNLNVELEQRVIERTALLEAKSRELETFTYSVSHDLKAPLRGIDGYSRLLLEDYKARLDEEGRTFLQNIRQATEQMNRLIEDLLTYSRLERRELHVWQIELQPIVETIVNEYGDEIHALNAAITTSVSDIEVFADPNGVTMALRNLFDNALKFSRDVDRPHIEIGAHETDTGCVVWVRDNGVGFDMKYHDRIFEIFQRLHRAEVYNGTGVGLAIVRKAVERMGGRTWAESEIGQGATFFIEIPRQ